MFLELLRAFTLIFFAEMGDKSQILAMTFASRYKIRNVIIGISLGIFLNHSLAVAIGVFIPGLFNIEYLSFFAGLVFILFGLMSLNITEEVKDVKKSRFGVTLTITLAIFLGELGDKTQLSAIVLASETSYPLLILFSTVSAMILTSLLGIFIGIKFGSKIPEFTIKIVSSLVFIFFGFLKVLQNVPTVINNQIYVILFVIIIVIIYGYLLYKYNQNYQESTSVYKKKAEELRNYYLYIKDKLEDICLGKEVCQSCQGNFCLLGYTKVIVKNTLNHQPVKLVNLEDKVRKEFDQEKIKEALDLTLNVLKDNWDNSEYHNLHEIRNSFELLLFDNKIEADTYQEYQLKISTKM